MTARPLALDPAPTREELLAARAHKCTLVAWRARGCPAVPAQQAGKKVKAPRPWAPYRSKLEARYAEYLDGLCVLGRVLEWVYEPETLDLGGARYTPDFLVAHADGSATWDEVKGYSRRYDRLTLRIAAARFPDRVFRRVEWVRGNWKITPIDPRPRGAEER